MIIADAVRAVAQARTRASWNDRLTHWERPPSDHEEGKIQRAANICTNFIANNQTLQNEGVRIRPQGSYFNNTNVRLEADMDLRVQHPNIITRYAAGVDIGAADAAAGYYAAGKTGPETARILRAELASVAIARFGHANVEVGSKAVTIDGFDGGIADVDLVPALNLHWISNNVNGGFHTDEGIIIYGGDGSETINFPEQHHTNGIYKRQNTLHRFKKVVRMLKRLNYELKETDAISNRAPSFLVECLVYLVENHHFLHNDDDRYGRLLRVVERALDLVNNQQFADDATEVNGIKYLFRAGQAWTRADAQNFLAAAVLRLRA
ncbi:hypothetical protein [Sphingobium sp. YC-XJ3]|uniref:hypothetical protein n=1 Tax=Sphingobium sp. YC-XJ3 TaxID=3024245 RepID=UPI002361EA07|nr:hypothetical protein [Sphingobium sp. YC-XJ3]WDA38954.1 hypothetical protein PO876_12635 [Sphingobium sp. YC-XJ3]